MKQANTQIIEQTIQLFIDNKELFTAYDVTKQIRHAGYHVEHKNIQRVIRNYNFASVDYIRDRHSVLNALVYYHRMDDVDDYRKDRIPEFDVTQSHRNSQANTKNAILDKRGRFTLSCKHVREANLQPYTKVTFESKNGEIIIRQTNPTEDGNATVDIYSNIRITQREFHRAFNKIPSEADLKISVVRTNGTGTITISI